MFVHYIVKVATFTYITFYESKLDENVWGFRTWCD
jgi:hypothetical protein